MIDPTAQLAAMIRAQFGAQFRAQAKRRPNVGKPGPREQFGSAPLESSSPVEGGAVDVQQLVALRVGALSADDPQRHRKAFRIFLESVLMQTFGPERIDALGFNQLVDTVMQRMEGEPSLQGAMREAADHLLAESAPK
ncbi:hypothetical protein [Variovorax ginsengisoli]|uniref:Uncharacterized protein n=1 Tax=Variovorax ginsengisoli TaxID=363844 RepID=A0ABT8SE47_9BURK|nr:hypothetical protein [Variovorax ginsengisoli]MDN8618026.1 hypothetical protein [Variovorax ginsengisoli]MDO1537196.1 hypothetical protein [Variovorax ginsengisoli]